MSPTQPTPFTGTRVALVTGGAQGIGRAIALRLAADGLDVAIDDVQAKSDQAEKVVSEIKALGRKAVAFTYDVSKEEQVSEMVEKTAEVLGRLDVMVANAGIGTRETPILEADIGYWQSIWAVNINGVLFCYKHAARQMVKQGNGGRIIGASSICGKRGFAQAGAYCVSKAAVLSLTQTAALELDQHGITVNAYAPAVIATEMATSENDASLCSETKKFLGLPGSKVGQPEHIAGLVSYLASPQASFMTGQTIAIDGGLLF